jgi:hypothetical protein
VLAARAERVVHQDLETVLPFPGPEERDGVADVADSLQGGRSLDVRRVAGQDGDVVVQEQRDEPFESSSLSRMRTAVRMRAALVGS